MTITIRNAAAICAVLTSTFAIGISPAVGQDVVRLDLANEFAASTLPAESEVRFIELVTEMTGGSIVITPHFGGALGYSSRDVFTAVRDGGVAIASSPFDKYVGFAPIFKLQSLPFLTPSVESTETLFNIARPYYEKAFNDANQTLLLGEPWTPQGIWAREKITSVDGITGLKVRSYDSTGTKTLKAAGASPVQLAGSDVVPALSTGTIDAVLTSDESGVSGRYWEHGVKYFNLLGYTMGISAVTMNLDAYNKLSDEQKEQLRAAAAQAEKEAWAKVHDRIKHNKQVMADNGAEFIDDVPDAVIDHLKAAGAPELDAWKAEMGPEADKIMNEFNEAMAK